MECDVISEMSLVLVNIILKKMDNTVHLFR